MSKPPRNFLGATKRIGENDVLVTEIEPELAVSAGVTLRSLGKDVISLQEEHSARLEKGIGLEAWASMDLDEKALLIAQRRNRIAMENLLAEAQIKHAENKAKRAK